MELLNCLHAPAWLIEFIRGMTPPAWSALISTIALLVAIYTQIASAKRDVFARQLSFIDSLNEKFESDEFRKHRRLAAQYLINNSIQNKSVGVDALDRVLGFFEHLGFLYSKNAIEAETAWTYFGSWLPSYSYAAQEHIKKHQKKDQNLYSELLKIDDAIRKIEAKRHASKSTNFLFTEQAVTDFLQQEIACSTEKE